MKTVAAITFTWVIRSSAMRRTTSTEAAVWSMSMATGAADHLHIFEAIVTPTTADRHDHGLGPHNHTAGIAHNHFHFNGMTIRFPSTYDTASRASSAIEEVQNEPVLLTTSATTDANAEDAEDVCFCDENMVFNDTGTPRVMSAATSLFQIKGRHLLRNSQTAGRRDGRAVSGPVRILCEIGMGSRRL